MKLWHNINIDDVIGTKRGIIVERYDGKVESVSLLLSVRGFRQHLHFVDWRKGVVVARTDYWLRLVWNGRAFGLPRFQFYRGASPDPRVRIGESTGTAKIYSARSV